jgi:hypothetical protein
MTKLNSSRLATDVTLIAENGEEFTAGIDQNILTGLIRKFLLDVMKLLASEGVMDTATMAEKVSATRLDGTATAGVGYDILVPSLDPDSPYKIEVKTRTGVWNKSSNRSRKEQKIVVRLSREQKKADYLLIQAVVKDRFDDQNVVTYFLIPHQAFYENTGEFKKGFDLRFNQDGLPIGNCKYTQYSFVNSTDMKERLLTTPTYRPEKTELVMAVPRVQSNKPVPRNAAQTDCNIFE